MKNTAARYGLVTKVLHWTVFLLILNQFVVAAAMLNTPQGETTAGFTQGTLYNWHKSIGLIALAVALARFVWRKSTPLPDWAPHLSDGEKRWIGRIETTLYLCMFLMPASGFAFVMTGGHGVHFFGEWHLPNLLGENESVALVADWTHRVTAVLLVLALLAHWGVGIRHQRIHRDRYLHRMLPFTHQK
jgi:cytochrome b561